MQSWSGLDTFQSQQQFLRDLKAGPSPIDSHQTCLTEDRQASVTEFNHGGFLSFLFMRSYTLGGDCPIDMFTHRKRFNKLGPFVRHQRGK